MSTELMPTNGTNQDYEVTRPNSLGMHVEAQRSIAEVQAALTIAASRPRNEKRSIEKIENACQRPALAEMAEYVYERGGTEITGPTIALMEVIANAWGNISFGFRELSNSGSHSEVEAFAWDLESNTKRTVVFTVKHQRHTKKGNYALTDPRDVYENLANYSQRRVRACLEAVIPPDVVEMARIQCNATMNESAEVTAISIQKLLASFAGLGVTREQVEKRIQRRIESIQPAQFVRMRQIYKSISDGMSKPSDWFEIEEVKAIEAPKTPAESARAAVQGQKKKTAPVKQEPAPEATDPPSQSDDGPSLPDGFFDAVRAAQNVATVDILYLQGSELVGDNQDLLNEICLACDTRKAELTEKGAKGKNPDLFNQEKK